MNSSPKSILMIKSHSMGIGDLLRSTAAWRSLKIKWPHAKLHLLFLSKHPGYSSENFISKISLLSSATFLTISNENSNDKKTKIKSSFFSLAKQVEEHCRRISPDLVIDFESSGIRTSIFTIIATRFAKAKSVGINQFYGRRFFYSSSSASTRVFAKQRRLEYPLEYTNKDYVVLSELGIERQDTPIEIDVFEEGLKFFNNLSNSIDRSKPIIGINIGCGTEDAIPRRPPIEQLVLCIGEVTEKMPCTLLLQEAPFESKINKEFIDTYKKYYGDNLNIVCIQCTLPELTGLIDFCDYFISSDSGPYHISVALQKPTIAWFNFPTPTAYHNNAWCRMLVNPSPVQFKESFDSLKNFNAHKTE
jgi:ADP-heptose:LPS heptosyltransferase